MTRSPLTALLALGLFAAPGFAQEGRELEVLRTFVSSFDRQLNSEILPQFPVDSVAVTGVFQGYSNRTAGPLYRDGRGLAIAAWRLKDSIQEVLAGDLVTMKAHKDATPELELLYSRLEEIVALRKNDGFYAEQAHFATAMGRFRVRFETLGYLVKLAARSVGLSSTTKFQSEPAAGTGNGIQRDPNFADLGG